MRVSGATLFQYEGDRLLSPYLELGLAILPIKMTTSKPIQQELASLPTRHISYLDGWRGLAIALVLEGHFLNAIPLETGRMGVDVFFCLSGFLMSGLLFVKKQPLQMFYKRRISRILPAFFLFVISIYVFAYFQHLEFKSVEVASTLLFLRTYLPGSSGIWGTHIPIGHIWSLNVEEHSYIFMSLIVLLWRYKGHAGIILMAAGVACIGIGFLYVKMGSGAPRWGALGTEVVASHLLISAGYRLIREKNGFNVPRYLPLIAIALAPVCYSKMVPWWSASLFSPFILAFSINHLSQTYDWFKLALSTPILKFLGIWSFSLYLWQQPFYAYKASFPGGSLMALTAAFALSLFCFYVWEQPIRSWLNKHWLAGSPMHHSSGPAQEDAQAAQFKL
jgi:peptidoglycan/LPS O-acetylase OafA/YrhL